MRWLARQEPFASDDIDHVGCAIQNYRALNGRRWCDAGRGRPTVSRFESLIEMRATLLLLLASLAGGCSSDRTYGGRSLLYVTVGWAPHETKVEFSDRPQSIPEASLRPLVQEVWEHGAIVRDCLPNPDGQSARIRIMVSWEVREITPPANCLSPAGKMLIAAVQQVRASTQK